MVRDEINSKDFVATLIRRVIYPLWTMRDHPKYRQYAQLFERSQWLSPEEIELLQMRMLQAQLIHAYSNVPLYRRRMEAAGITPLDIHSRNDLRMLPVLTKRDIQNHAEELVAGNIPRNLRCLNQTGGSTGTPLEFWVDRERYDSRRASTDRHNAWAGLRPGDWCAVLWGSTYELGTQSVPKITWRQRLLDRSLMLNTSLVSKDDLNEFVALLRRYRPRRLKAYAQSAAMFARYCQETGVDDIHFDSIVTSAEVLLPENRELIEEIFGGKVFNRYGCREVSVIASECEQHSGLHVNADALLVEIEPIANGPEGFGRVLVTDLYNRSLPLIRYEIGDIAQWADDGPCECGRGLPRLRGVEGRITDFLRMPDGRMVSGPSLALLVGQTPGVRQAQFVQQGPLDIRLDLIPGNGYGPYVEDDLRRRLHPYFRDQVRFAIRRVESIPMELSGKFRFVKTESNEARAS
jgi:phenylacetate-coenzyme A ligase PaaK-like adenylate-forming protein